MSVISNLTSVGLLIATTAGSTSESASLVALLVNTQFLDQVKVKHTSQLMLKYFNGTTILTFSVYVSFPSNFPVILVL